MEAGVASIGTATQWQRMRRTKRGVLFRVHDVLFRVHDVLFRVRDVLFQVHDVLFRVRGTDKRLKYQ